MTAIQQNTVLSAQGSDVFYNLFPLKASLLCELLESEGQARHIHGGVAASLRTFVPYI